MSEQKRVLVVEDLTLLGFYRDALEESGFLPTVDPKEFFFALFSREGLTKDHITSVFEKIYHFQPDAIVIHFSEESISPLVINLSQIYPLIVLLSSSTYYQKEIERLPKIYRKRVTQDVKAVVSFLKDPFFWQRK